MIIFAIVNLLIQFSMKPIMRGLLALSLILAFSYSVVAKEFRDYDVGKYKSSCFCDLFIPMDSPSTEVELPTLYIYGDVTYLYEIPATRRGSIPEAKCNSPPVNA